MPGRLAGRQAVVTGAARGIGAAIAAAFVAEGASVVVADQLVAEGEATVAALGGAARLVAGDLTEPPTWERILAACGPRLDVLVNNAGGLRHPQPLHELELDDWRDELDRNLTSVFLGMRAAIPAMLRGGGGSIVNMSSISGAIGQDDAPAYQAAKAGIRLLTKNAAVTYGAQGIRVNAICPGAIDTQAVRGEDPARLGPFLARTPLGRQGLPDDVARAAVYLASDESAFVTGIDLFIDGGYSSR
jgi:3alpha(or 20beta)-hydroxysteroid dehydrogenase